MEEWQFQEKVVNRLDRIAVSLERLVSEQTLSERRTKIKKLS